MQETPPEKKEPPLLIQLAVLAAIAVGVPVLCTSGEFMIPMIFYGGFVVAFVGLLAATILALCRRSLGGWKWFCVVAAFCGLIYEGGCIAAASGIGRATGGGGGDSWMTYVGVAFLIAFVWSVVILGLSLARNHEGDGDKKKSE